MQRYFGMTGGWLTFWVSVACSTDMTLFGYDQGVFGGTIVTPDFLDTLGLYTDKAANKTNSSLIGTITALYDIGCFVGAVLAFELGERIGRKKTIILGTTVMTIGAILQVSCFSVGQLITGRMIAGIGNGLNTSTAPVWQSETSKANWRGKLVVIEMIMNIAGFSLSNWMTYGFSFVGGPVAWRFPLAFQLFFNLILFSTVPWLPESPRWLISHGRIDEAEQIMADLEATDIDDPFIITQSKEIQWTVQKERENAVPFTDLLRGRTGKQSGNWTMRRLMLGSGTQIMQQLTGINITSYYLPTVLTKSVGLSTTTARLLAACNSVSYLIFSTIAIPNVERWGRRWLMMGGAAGQSICYLLITVLIRYNEMPGFAHATECAKASIVFFFLYYVCFGIGWQGVPWLYPTEVNSLAMRTRGAALGTASNWIFNFMVVEITPIGIDNLQWKFYTIWTIFNAAFVPIIYMFYPETAGRSLEDMDKFFQESNSIFVLGNKEAIQSGRPERYKQEEEAEVRRNSSIANIEGNQVARRIRQSQSEQGGRGSTASAVSDEKGANLEEV